MWSCESQGEGRLAVAPRRSEYDASLATGAPLPKVAGDKAARIGYTPAAMRVITTTSELAAICEDLAKHEFVTVDTEFLREQTFWPQLCLIQLAGPGIEAIVDPMVSGIDL